jgi:hypothetical protein
MAECPPEVMITIRQDVLSDYAAAADVLSAQVDVLLIEHEFGIFGAVAGDFVLTMARRLSVPMVLTLHAVLSAPSVEQALVLRALGKQAAIVTVFTETARRLVSKRAWSTRVWSGSCRTVTPTCWPRPSD